MSELKPCPFCGGEAELSEYGGPQYLVECPFCEAGTFTGRVSKDQAIEDWNARPPMQDCAKEMYAMLDRLYKESALVYGDDYDAAEKLLTKARGESCD